MYYIYLIKKNQGENSNNKLIRFINLYNQMYGTDDFFISLPGYIGETKATIDYFCSKFLKTSKKKRGIFLNPVNVKMLKTRVKNIDYLNSIFGGYKCSSILPKKDHSKMIAFFKNSVQFDNDINIKDVINGNIKIKCLVIGSSNQNKTTYLSKSASKGEMDVVLIDESVFIDHHFSEIKKQTQEKFEEDINNYAIDLLNESKINEATISKQIKETGYNELNDLFSNFFEKIK